MTAGGGTPDTGREHVGAVGRGGALNLMGAAASAFLGIGLTLVVARMTSEQLAGQFFAVTSAFLIAMTVAGLGVGFGLVYFIARLRALDDRRRIRALTRAGLRTVIRSSVVLALVGVIAAVPLGRTLDPDGSGSLSAVIIVLALFLPLATLYDVTLAATRGFGRMAPTVAVEKVARPLAQVVLVALSLALGGLVAATAGWLIPYGVTLILSLLWLRRLLARTDRPAGTDPQSTPTPVDIHSDGLLRSFHSFSRPRAATAVVQMALQRLDIVLIALLVGPAPAAIYTVATRFLVLGQFGQQAIGTAAEPRLAGLLSTGDRAGALAVYRSTTAWLVLIHWPMFLVFAALAPWLLQLFGPGYTAGTSTMVVLCLAMLVATGVGVVDIVVAMTGRAGWPLVNSIVALSVMVIGDLVLIPPFGILGAAVAWATAIVCANILPLIVLQRVERMHPFDRRLGFAAGLSLACFGPGPAAAALLTDRLLPTIAAVVVGTVVFATVSWRARGFFQLDLLMGQLRIRR